MNFVTNYNNPEVFTFPSTKTSNFSLLSKMFKIFVYFCVILKIISAKKPEIIQFSSLFTAEKNEAFQLICGISKGSKPIEFEWFKDGVKIYHNSDVTVETKTLSSSIQFDSVRITDSGNYSCRASNDDGSDQSSTYLQVKGLDLEFLIFVL